MNKNETRKQNKTKIKGEIRIKMKKALFFALLNRGARANCLGSAQTTVALKKIMKTEKKEKEAFVGYAYLDQKHH